MEGEKMSEPTDRKGRPIKPGDLLKVFHFRAARRRKVYMYRVVIEHDGHLRAADIADAAKPGWEHTCPVEVIENPEIIDGPSERASNGELVCWWERPRVPTSERKQAPE